MQPNKPKHEGECGSDQAPSRNHRYPSNHPLGARHNSSLEPHNKHHLFNNLPSTIIIGLIVILLVIVALLLYYAKQTGKLQLAGMAGSNNGGGGVNAGGGASAQGRGGASD